MANVGKLNVILLAVGASIVLSLAAHAGPPSPTGDRVTLCHQGKDSKGKAVTIEVSANAVPVHLAHGDSLGECL